MLRTRETKKDYLARKRQDPKFDPSDLAEQFWPHFRTGQRIKVRFTYGEEMTGTVGVTTGWKPAFLLMRTSRSMGSPWTLGRDDTIIAVQEGKKYVEVAS